MRISILGAGAWGTALAVSLASRHPVTLWARDAGQAARMAAERRNTRYLPGVALPADLAVNADPAAAFRGAELALVAVPTAGLRSALDLIGAHAPGAPVVWACKGFERDGGRLPHRVVAGTLPAGIPCGALSGPSFALEVARGQPTALVLASSDEAFARDTARALHHARLRVYYSTDVAGVEVGGALKNVMAIATGICDGLDLGMNARAALITRGLAEIGRLAVRLGGRAETMTGLAVAGDLILTCTGDLSRNRRVGLELAAGRPLADILGHLGHVAEGVPTAREALRLARAHGVDMPITAAVCAVLEGELRAVEAVERLLARDPRPDA